MNAQLHLPTVAQLRLLLSHVDSLTYIKGLTGASGVHRLI
jgi:hypothetical protein